MQFVCWNESMDGSPTHRNTLNLVLPSFTSRTGCLSVLGLIPVGFNFRFILTGQMTRDDAPSRLEKPSYDKATTND